MRRSTAILPRLPVERVPEFEEKFSRSCRPKRLQYLQSIARSRDLASQTEEELKTQLQKFEETHPDLFK